MTIYPIYHVLTLDHSKYIAPDVGGFSTKFTLSTLGIYPVAEDGQWRKRVGFVSSFGFGGANAVCGFEQAPETGQVLSCVNGEIPNPTIIDVHP